VEYIFSQNGIGAKLTIVVCFST